MATTVKKDRRDRYDRIYLRDISAMHAIMPYMMPKRCDNEAVLDEVIDITAVNEYLDRRNSDNPDFKFTWFHVIAAALAKTLVLRPKMNHFISGYRLFERRDISIAFQVKRAFEDHAEEATAIFRLDREGGSPVDQVHDYVRDFVTKVRVNNEVEGSTGAMNFLKKFPRPVLKFVFWALRRLEYHGIFPKALAAEDPMHASVYVSNLGSIKMKANYHHLYEFGTLSFFVVINEKTLRPFFNPDGTYTMKDTIAIGMTIDERIADGYYFAKSLRVFKHLLEHPELLDLDAGAPIDFQS